MALNKSEKAILEAVGNLLNQDAKLGLTIHNDKEISHLSQFRWEGIDDLFTLKASNSPYKDSLTSAFYAVHSHKYIDHPTFKLSLEKELTARGVPTVAREAAMKFVDAIIEDLSAKNPSEHDAGWNPHMKDIVDLTSNADNRTPKREEPFTGGGPWPKGDRNNGTPIGEAMGGLPGEYEDMGNFPEDPGHAPTSDIMGHPGMERTAPPGTKYCEMCDTFTPDNPMRCQECGTPWSDVGMDVGGEPEMDPSFNPDFDLASERDPYSPMGEAKERKSCNCDKCSAGRGSGKLKTGQHAADCSGSCCLGVERE